jgi:CheY-like chemotaxis protein
VLNNLLGNAIKFTHEGLIHLRIEVVEADEQQALLRFAMRDTGIGLSKEQSDRLFRPFVQADGSTTRRYGGTGLGLTISRHFVELMDGKIAVSSAPGEGSTFAFTARFGIGQERRNMVERHHLHGLRTLVVDDQDISLEILSAMIQSWSGDVTTLRSGETVVEEMIRAEAEGRPYELILLDWQMPGVDGLEVARQIEQEAAAGRVQRQPMVVMVTAFDKDRLAEQAAARLDGILTKPVTPSSLFNAVMAVRTPSLARHQFDSRRPDSTPYEIAHPIRGAHVLVVEDNVINQEVAREFLEKAGLRVALADNGRLGVEAVRNGQFDAVLMDMQMPEMDGLEATRLIRTLPGFAGLPIIAMTAAAMPRDKQACSDAGMSDHVSKPIVPKELLAALVRWIKPREGMDSPALPSPDADFPPVAGIDSRQASVRLAGNRPLFMSLLGQMVDKFQGTITELRAAIADGQFEQAARSLHALRGVAGNVSAIEVARVASDAEAAVKDGKADEIPHLLDRLEDALARLFAAIISLPAEKRPRIGSAAPLTPAMLEPLMAALREQDAAALDLFNGVEPALEAAHGSEFADRLRTAVDGLHFDAALTQLKTMRGAQ